MLSLLIFLSFIVIRFAGARGLTTLYWNTNQAGVFSQYLQLKAVYHHCTTRNKQLVVVPSQSYHYPKETLNLCNLFNLPIEIVCAEIPANFSCENNFFLAVANQLEDTCYEGKVFFGSLPKGSGVMYMIRAVELPLQLLFNDMYVSIFENFRNAISRYSQINFTVVHWRRGDQFTSRCKNGKDQSVNCDDAEDLLHKVRHHTNSSTIYVATNEPQNSDAMVLLRKKGFLTYHSLASLMPHAYQSDSLAQLAVDVQLMLDAHTYLAWGVSEVHDVVEYERMRAGKSYCVGHVGSRMREGEQLNWCAYHLGQSPLNGTIDARNNSFSN